MNQPSTQTTLETPDTNSSADKNKNLAKTCVVILVLFVLLALLSFGCVFVWNNYYSPGEGDSSSSASATSSNTLSVSSSSSTESMTSESFNGDFVQGSIPTGWSIIEYQDGDGTDFLIEDTDYKGLTGLGVQNSLGKTVFKVQAIDGIGGLDVCETLYMFPDTEQDYIDLYSTSEFLSGSPPTIIDLGNDYSEYSFLGVRVRRVDSKLYWTTMEAGAFNPACGINENIVQFDEITFEVSFPGLSESYDGDSFTIEITAGTSEADLIILDDILENLEII